MGLSWSGLRLSKSGGDLELHRPGDVEDRLIAVAQVVGVAHRTSVGRTAARRQDETSPSPASRTFSLLRQSVARPLELAALRAQPKLNVVW